MFIDRTHMWAKKLKIKKIQHGSGPPSSYGLTDCPLLHLEALEVPQLGSQMPAP